MEAYRRKPPKPLWEQGSLSQHGRVTAVFCFNFRYDAPIFLTDISRLVPDSTKFSFESESPKHDKRRGSIYTRNTVEAGKLECDCRPTPKPREEGKPA